MRLRFEVAGIVPLVELIRGIAAQPVDFAAALHRRALAEHRRPALQILTILHLQEFGAAILIVLRKVDTARFYFQRLLPQVVGLAEAIEAGARNVREFAEAAF